MVSKPESDQDHVGLVTFLWEIGRVVSHLHRGLTDADSDRREVRVGIIKQCFTDLGANVLGQEFGGGIGDGEHNHVFARKEIVTFAKENFPAGGSFVDDKVGVGTRQEKTMIKLLADLFGASFQDSEIEDQLILTKFTLDLDQDAIVVPMQVLAFATIGNEVGGTKIEVAALDFDFAPDGLVIHDCVSSFSVCMLCRMLAEPGKHVVKRPGAFSALRGSMRESGLIVCASRIALRRVRDKGDAHIHRGRSGGRVGYKTMLYLIRTTRKSVLPSNKKGEMCNDSSRNGRGNAAVV
jgi:hypothetical protein